MEPNFVYYARNYAYNALPVWFFRKKYQRIRQYEQRCDKAELQQRLDYYFKVNKAFELPAEAVAVKNFRKTRGTGYFLDLKEFLHYFTPTTRFAYFFGDETHINAYPTLFKARPIAGPNANSVLFKLNKRRHFRWVNDNLSFRQKEARLVWRGGIRQQQFLRQRFVEQFWDHPHCNVGQTNQQAAGKPWHKPPLSIQEQLQYKFIFCPEGNDVATSLKWAMSSNSLCIMPKPRYETWFMEGTLRAGCHYVEVQNDLSDLEDLLEYYLQQPAEAEAIIRNAHQHVARFQDAELEDLLCLKVLERYTQLSGQSDALRFN